MSEFEGFLADLSSAEPVPGGGSVAALQTAMAASLLVMVGNLTVGRSKFAPVEGEVRPIMDQAAELRDRSVLLAREDTDAYGAVAAVFAMPRGSDEEKSARRERMQTALKGAAQPPLATMRTAAEVLQLAERLVGTGNPAAVSDVGTAALAARAGFHAARLNVEINMASVRDETWVATMRDELSAMPEVDRIADEVLARTERAIRGDAG